MQTQMARLQLDQDDQLWQLLVMPAMLVMPCGTQQSGRGGNPPGWQG
jgi:hypothetical protein